MLAHLRRMQVLQVQVARFSQNADDKPVKKSMFGQVKPKVDGASNTQREEFLAKMESAKQSVEALKKAQADKAQADKEAQLEALRVNAETEKREAEVRQQNIQKSQLFGGFKEKEAEIMIKK